MSSTIDFRPFQALRPPNDLAKFVSCPPYNYLNKQEARAFAQTHPRSFIHVSRPEVDLARTIHAYQEPSGIVGKQNLASFVKNNLLVKDQEPAFYIYRQSNNNKTYTGIFGTIAIKHYLENRIKAHEKTIQKKVTALCRFTQQENAHVDPALLIYQQQPTLDAFIKKLTTLTPSQLFEDEESTQHALWLINDDRNIQILQQLIGSIDTLYIADGHHRTTAAAQLYKQSPNEKYSHYLVGLFAADQIDILAYNRIIKQATGPTLDKLIKQAKKHYIMTPYPKGNMSLPTSGSFGMLIHDNWYHLQPKQTVNQQFDVQRLYKQLLEPILQVTSTEQSAALGFIGGRLTSNQIREKCTISGWPVAFMLQPVSFTLFQKTVDSGAQMPPKTTWFEPKIRPGLIIQELL